MRTAISLFVVFALGLAIGWTYRDSAPAAASGSPGGGGEGGGAYLCADVNGDSKVDISDAVYLLTWLFKGGPDPKCPPSDCCPNLVVQDIDMGTLSVSCPGGVGTCKTTVSFTIANTGGGAAGPFKVLVAFDPGVSTTLSVAGLAASSTLTLTATSPVGGNCYDPDCTICVTVDSAREVDECDETDNRLCETRNG